MEYHSATDYRTVFNAMPGASALIKPDSPLFTVVASTDEFAAFAGTTRENLIGESLFHYFPDNPAAPNVSEDIRMSLASCIATKKTNELPLQRYDISNNDGTFWEMYWRVVHTPVLDTDGEIEFIIHTAVDVTDNVAANFREEKIKSLEPANNLFTQSSLAIHIFKGPEMIISLANNTTLDLWNRDETVIGKPLREVLPELFSQKYPEVIDRVRLTGIPYHAHEAPVILEKGGDVTYLNFVLQPYYENGSIQPVGVQAIVNDVTDIVNDRKALAEKEKSLELAVEIGELGVFNIDLQSNSFTYSPQIMKWFGVDRLNIPLRELLRKVHPEDFKLVSDTLTRTVKGETYKHDITFRVNGKSGTQQYLRSIGQLQFQDGKGVALSGIIQDISSSIHSRNALEQGAHRLKSLIESAPFPIGVYVGREMRIEMANQAILDAWGRPDVIGKTYSEVLPELEGKGPYEQLDDVFTTGRPFHAHNQRVDLMIDGVLQTFYYNYSYTPLFDNSGAVYGVMNTAADVTDLIVAKQNLEQSEKNFRNIILQAPVAMCLLVGPEHVLEVANDSMLAIWGKDRADVIYKPIFEGLPDVKEQGLEQLLSDVYYKGVTVTASEQPFSLLRFGKPDVIYLNFVYEPYLDGDGTILGVLAIAIDVTEQFMARQKIEDVVKERTKELELANANLQKSNAELEQFAYIASHDLQEPLRKISMFTSMLEGAVEEPNQRTRLHMNNISSAVTRMTNLIKDILGYSQLSKNDVFEETNLEQIFAEAVADLDLVLMEKSGAISHSGLVVIDAIPLQMTQLFHNLISNSLKYTKPGVAPNVTITGFKLADDECLSLGLPLLDRGYHKLVFKDNGIGFAQEYAEKIFSIFQRLHTKTQYEGTGIGLAMCKKIADNHHGFIYAIGSEGEGAEFIVILPISQRSSVVQLIPN